MDVAAESADHGEGPTVANNAASELRCVSESLIIVVQHTPTDSASIKDNT
jgi:hypothetical protein